ncbi:hypothetical protein ACIBQ1_46355 [Nonomuraea sp. NPDC050153]
MMPGTLTPERRLVLTGPAARPWHPSVTALRDLCAEAATTW